MIKIEKELASQTGWSAVERPRFSPGLLLEAQDLNASVDYTREMMRLMLKSLFGCGVVCGLKVSSELSCNDQHVTVVVEPGFALDCDGNLIHVPRPQSLTYKTECKPLPPHICVVLKYTEQCTRPRDVSCSSEDDSERVHTRSAQGFVIQLLPYCPPGVCGCGEFAEPEAPDSSRGGGGCCQNRGKTQATASEASTAAKGFGAGCACYEAHNRGDCGCDCGCGAVFLASLVLGSAGEGNGQLYTLSGEQRRQVRPVLTGFLACLQPAAPGPTGSTGETGSTGATINLQIDSPSRPVT
jgi:hypothetical protein